MGVLATLRACSGRLGVVVEESRRGTGLGRQIMADTLRTAWDAGCHKAMLMTGSRNPATHGFYRACGFSPDIKTAYLARPAALPARSAS
ncbi:GNAT family N-acetyltransferase [Micromonospora arida]